MRAVPQHVRHTACVVWCWLTDCVTTCCAPRSTKRVFLMPVLLLLLLAVQVAFDNSVDKHRVTPYSRAATEAFDMVYSGGKPDDITVLVAVIS